MLCEVDQQFLYDDSNFNGLKPWELKDYDITSFKIEDSAKPKESSGDSRFESFYFKKALNIIESGDNSYEPTLSSANENGVENSGGKDQGAKKNR